jgi:hypothetical protein
MFSSVPQRGLPLITHQRIVEAAIGAREVLLATRIGPVFGLLAAWLLTMPTGAQEPKMSVREFVTVAGTVERIDRVTRILTLRVGSNVTQGVYVPPEIKLFDELKTGDHVSARIRESVIVSARPGLKPQLPTDTTADAANARGGAGEPEVVQQVKAVVTIDNIDRKAQIIAYRTADNRHIVRAVADPHLIEGLKPGDVVEITLTRERVLDLQRQR